MTDAVRRDLDTRMSRAIDAMERDFGAIRTGRASTALLDTIQVEVYGTNMPLGQVATVSVPEARLLTVQVWDRSNVQPVEKAIRSAGIGLNPITDGQLIRLPIPELTEERRRDLTRMARNMAEEGKVSVRNVRRDEMRDVHELRKEGEVSEDDERRAEAELQKLTDGYVKRVDAVLADKEAELLEV